MTLEKRGKDWPDISGLYIKKRSKFHKCVGADSRFGRSYPVRGGFPQERESEIGKGAFQGKKKRAN